MSDFKGLDSASWRTADASADAAARYLEVLTKVLAEQKRQTVDNLHLGPGKSALEIGCGMGRESEAMAAQVGPTGRVVGLDASRELIAQAIARTQSLGLPLVYQVGDAHALDFPDNSFDCARAERVLQHLAEPAKALSELVRVVKPGGRLSVLEPDWESVSVGGVDVEVTRAVVRYKTDVLVTNGTIGRDLRRLLVEAGCVDVSVEMGAVTFGQFPMAANVMSLRQSLDGARDKGWITQAAADAWWAELEEQERGGKFLGYMCGTLAAARVG
jgi:ubiquinone/menaquinone biosynthesis C-methylase UbiE